MHIKITTECHFTPTKTSTKPPPKITPVKRVGRYWYPTCGNGNWCSHFEKSSHAPISPLVGIYLTELKIHVHIRSGTLYSQQYSS